jgi:class 3 adenylate cyclase
MEQVSVDKIPDQLKYIVYWVKPTGQVIPKNRYAHQLVHKFQAKDNLIQSLFQLNCYDEIVQRAKNRKGRTCEISVGNGLKKTVVWEFIPGRDGVVCLSVEWRMVEQLLQNVEEGNAIFNDILLNVFPDYIIDELITRHSVHPKVYRHSTIMFTDVVNFSRLAFHLDPVTLIRKLDSYFSLYDEIIDEYGIEKIKTIGDSYMCAAGLPVKRESHSVDCCLAALNLLHKMEEQRTEENIIDNIDVNNWLIRIGIHSGPCISGVVGLKKYTFDIWGDSVNIAARLLMESDPGKINISEKTYTEVKDFFDCGYRGKQEIKNIGMVNMYFLNRLKKRYSEDKAGRSPNSRFKRMYLDHFYSGIDTESDHTVPSFIQKHTNTGRIIDGE